MQAMWNSLHLIACAAENKQLQENEPQTEQRQLTASQKIIKQGFLIKVSRHLKSERQRWTMLQSDPTENNHYIYTYTEQIYKKCLQPTESIRVDCSTDIGTFNNVMDQQRLMFYVENKKDKEKFLFIARSRDERNEWIKYLQIVIQTPTIIEQKKDETINELNSEIETLKESINFINVENQTLTESYEQLKQQNDILKQEQNKKIDKSQFHQLKIMYDQLMKQNKTLLAKLNGSESKHTQHKNKNQTLQSNYNTLKTQYNKLTIKFTQNKSKYNEQLKQSQALQSKYNASQAQYNSVKITCTQTESKYKQQLQQSQTLQAKYNELRTQYNSLATRLNETESKSSENIMALNEKVKSMQYIADGYYLIQNINSGLVLDIPDASKCVGVQIQQYFCGYSLNQIFYIELVERGVYTIKNKGNGLYLGIKGLSKKDGAAVIQSNCQTISSKWRFVEDGCGNWWIFNVNSGKCMHIPHASKNNKTKIQQCCPNGGHYDGGHQKFKLMTT